MECSICFEPISDVSITCCNRLCSVRLCSECFEDYLNHVSTESLLPRCVGTKCDAPYLQKDIPLNLHGIYVQSCYTALVQENQNQVNEEDRRKIILQKLRDEKKSFLRKEIPLAVATLAEIMFKVRLEKVELPTEFSQQRRCMHSYCPGSLDEELKCNICDTRFCVRCETPQEEHHQCKEEDVQAIQVKKSFPQCPNCGAYVDKDEACNSVKCGICGVSFIYGTNQIGGHGHIQMVEVKEKIKLSEAYRDALTPEMREQVLQIEARAKSKPSYKPVLNLVKQCLESNGLQKTQLVRAFNKYTQADTAHRSYFWILGQIEKQILDRTCSLESLQNFATMVMSL